VSANPSLLQQFAQSSQLSGGNATFIEGLYENYLRDTSSVSAEWKTYFDTFRGREAGDVPHSVVITGIEEAQKRNRNVHAQAAVPASEEDAQKQANVLRLVTAYRSRGHLAANLDPLGLAAKQPAPDLELAFHGLTDADLNTEFNTAAQAEALFAGRWRQPDSDAR
jgi:2-oxoglutarate dehydrogenase E1 component